MTTHFVFADIQSNGDALKTMLFSAPQEVRAGSGWVMNQHTGLWIATLKSSEDSYLIEPRNEGLMTTGIPHDLFAKPVVYEPQMDELEPGMYPVMYTNPAQNWYCFLILSPNGTVPDRDKIARLQDLAVYLEPKIRVSHILRNTRELVRSHYQATCRQLIEFQASL